jgi:DNA ligase-1
MTDPTTAIVRFAPLYKKTSTGAIQEWEIWTEGPTIHVRWGHISGAKQHGTDTLGEGKSQPDAVLQAQFEAEAKHTKQRKKGYVDSAEKAKNGEVDEIIEGGIAPMLAVKFSEHGDKIKYPAYVQPKFDGHRCTAEIEAGECYLWSRTRKPIISVPHIAKALAEMGFPGIPDGELYNHDYHANFEDLTSILNQKSEPAANHEEGQYHIYDIADEEKTFEERQTILSLYFDGLGDHPHLKRVLTLKVNNEKEMWDAYETFMEQGYEGAIVRNADGLYGLGRRSFDLQKVVKTFTDEFPIVRIEEGRGKDKGHAIFVVKLHNGLENNAKMKGNKKKLKEIFENQGDWIGQMLTVEFRGYTKKGKLRFPVALRKRVDL